MSDEQKMVREFTIYWKDERATAQFPEAAFGFVLAEDGVIDSSSSAQLKFTTLEGAKITVYTDKLLFTGDRLRPLAPPKPPTPPSASKPS